MKKSIGQIARRYSTALLESCKDSGEIEIVLRELESANQCLNSEVMEFMRSPVSSQADKEQVLETLQQHLKSSPIVKSGLKLILENNRMDCFSQIVTEFRQIADEKLEVLRVEVCSARTLAPGDLQEIESSLKTALKKKIVLTQKLDSQLLAGYVLRVGHIEVDVSLKSQLSRLKLSLKDSLNQGVS